MATGKITKRSVDAIEATGAKQFLWDDDLKGFGLQVWELPAERAKNGVANIIHLNDLAMAALDEIAMIGREDDDEATWPKKGLVFTTTGKTAVSGYSKAKKALDAKVADAAAEQVKGSDAEPLVIPAWRLHDLRRTVATGFQRLGIRFEVTEAVLNHRERAQSGVAGVYQRHDWKDEKRVALDAWARHIVAITGAPALTNVIRITTATEQAA